MAVGSVGRGTGACSTSEPQVPAKFPRAGGGGGGRGGSSPEGHLSRLGQGNCDPQSNVLFLELIHTMERISDHCRNLADIVANSQKKDYIIHEKAGA